MKIIRSLKIASTGLLLTLGVEVRADHVILDDCIIDGSLAVGLDAVNGENFGFDTIRVKENNLRFHFDDTSIAAAFPRNDWRLIANDSANGGDSYLGIEDTTGGRIPFRVEAGAGNHSLFVESTGDVGFGTNNPVVRAHLSDGDTPTLRLEQNGTSGWNPQTWDVAGNETNFFIRDVTHGSKLPFRIRPDAPTSSLEIEADGVVSIPHSTEIGPTNLGGGNRLHVVNLEIDNADDVVITDTGVLGIGTAAPALTPKVHIVQDADEIWRLQNSRAGTPANYVTFYDQGGRTGFFGHVSNGNDDMWLNNEAGGVLVLSVGGGADFTLDASGNVTTAGTVNGVSDRNAKRDIVRVDSSKLLEKVLDLPISEWTYNNDGDVRHIGPMAQDFRASFGLGKDDKHISFVDPAGVALAAIQGLHEVVEARDSRISELEKRNAELAQRLLRIEKALLDQPEE